MERFLTSIELFKRLTLFASLPAQERGSPLRSRGFAPAKQGFLRRRVKSFVEELRRAISTEEPVALAAA